MSAPRAWFRGVALAALCTACATVWAGNDIAGPDFGDHEASTEVRQVAQWVGSARDNDGLPFMLVDKVAARVYVFNAVGDLLGIDSALLGSARGDTTAPGIGDLPLAQIRPEHRTTPAGRFVAHLEKDVRGSSILVIDYEASIALHPLVPGSPHERRAERLRSDDPDEKRISFGCINVPQDFYESVVRRAFAGTAGVVYILPETTPISDFLRE
ncbi:L,D-transpeptidase [Alkalisalibacterium limincola]|uniref:L,D-transpeptidase n=1 Tax=Alkalisalibacterium limincola TaxID=2699169 RepID=UPI001C9CD328|nr:L,D-transpeptidase [Alkalisalibacterium limincola]